MNFSDLERNSPQDKPNGNQTNTKGTRQVNHQFEKLLEVLNGESFQTST